MKELLQHATNALKPIVTFAKPYYNQVQHHFLEWTSDINFTVFCLVYAIILIFLIARLTRKQNWRPKFKQIKTFKEKVKQKLYSILFNLPFLKNFINNKFQHQLDKQEVKIIADLQKHWDHRKVSSLPAEGMTEDNLRKRIYEWAEKQKIIWNTGKISGAFYVNSDEHIKEMNDFAAMYLYHNPLHLETYKQLLRIQKQILDMTNNLITSKDNNYYGLVTSGGSESLISAIYAYRNFYSNKTKPNLVMPVTAHAALDKGCFFLNVQCRKVKLNQKFQADLEHMQSLIDSNTIMVVASAPNYPHGIIDDIAKISKLAKKYNIGCHVDGCLGGFVGLFHKDYKDLFSLDRDGVTSVSLDHHKFGLAPKGISTVFYKTNELRQAQYYVNMDWIGGIYGTMGFPGSRSGFASAAGWYSLTQITMKGFKNNAEIIVNATQEGAENLRKLKGIKVFGDPKLCVIAFTTTQPQCSHLSLCDYLSHDKKWSLSTLHKPNGIHISVTLANYENVSQQLSKDVQQGLKILRAKKEIKPSIASVLYGTSAKIPTTGMEHEMLRLLVGASLK